MILQRALSVVSAALLVSAVAVATFGPQSISLGQALYFMDGEVQDALLVWSNRTLGDWAWMSVVQPLLVRPAWLLPASAGIICSGLAVSLSSRKTSHRSHRRS